MDTNNFEEIDKLRKMMEIGVIDASRPANTIVHRPPRIPFMIDDKETEKENLRDYNGKPLHTVVDNDAIEGKILRIFTTQDKAKQYCKTILPASSSNTNKKSEEAIGYVDLYEHENHGGCVWRLYDSQNYGDFSKVMSCGFMWWGWRNLDEKATSVDCALVRMTHAILCEHKFLGGSWLWLPARTWVLNLGAFGWNDRASSLHYMYIA